MSQQSHGHVIVAHDVVPGRTRFQIGLMRDSPSLASVLQDRLLHSDGVQSVAANPLTGTVLVLYDSLLVTSQMIADALEDALAASPWATGSESSPGISPRPAAPVPEPVFKRVPEPDLERSNGRRGRKITAPTAVPKTTVAPRARRSLQGISRRMPRPGGREKAVSLSEPWHTWSSDDVAAHFRTRPASGLPQSQASRRTGVYGRNEVPDIPRRPRSAILMEQLTSIPGLMLTAAAAFSFLTGAVTDAVLIGGAVIANATLGFCTEDYAERTIQSLRQVRTPHARVLREGRRTKIAIEDVVPGDILLLEPGQMAAADGRILRAENLVMDESLLTGETAGQSKSTPAIDDLDAPLAERFNMVYAGSAVASGKGAAIVTATGLDTELGHIRMLIGEAPDTPPPMSRELQKLGGTLALLSVGVCSAFGIAGLLLGLPTMEVLAIMASLAVSAIPEGLPTVATTTLALGMKRMREKNVVIRRLPAVAALGSATILCVDKTGTLTENRMSVRCFVLGDVETEIAATAESASVRCVRQGQEVSVQDDPLLLLAMMVGALCTEAELIQLPGGRWDASGSSTEESLLLTAVRAGIDVPRLRAEMQLKEIRERSSGRNYMVSVHRGLDGALEVFVKGAPEEVLALCSSEMIDGTTRDLTSRRQTQLLDWNESLAGRGMRVLGLAEGRLAPGEVWEGGHGKLNWVGLVGMEDPVRDEARQAVEQLARAGMRTLMLTGDQRVTAEAVGRAVGLGNGGTVHVGDGSTFAGAIARGEPLPDVLARVTPDNKFEIVRALQARGHIVMMTGDGVNDAPALKAADVGVAMGVRSTQVARDISDVILLDDNLSSIPIAVSQGRTIFTNIRKALRFLLSSNLSDIGLVGASIVLRLPFPLTALQLLWLNVVTDIFPAIALAMETSEPDVMDRPPRRPDERLLSPALWRGIRRDAAALGAGTFATYLWALSRYGGGTRARTVAFSTITLAQLGYALSCRSQTPGLRKSGDRNNRYLLTCLAGAAAAQFATVFVPPLRLVLGTSPLSLVDWMAVAAGSASVLALTEATKYLDRPALPAPAPSTTPRPLLAPVGR